MQRSADRGHATLGVMEPFGGGKWGSLRKSHLLDVRITGSLDGSDIATVSPKAYDKPMPNAHNRHELISWRVSIFL